MTVVLAGTLLVLVGNAAQAGLGVHTFSLAAGPLLVAVAGGVAGNAAACALALLHVLAIFLLAALETQGIIPGRGGVMQPTLEGRVSAHLLLTVGGLASALLLNRILGAALRRAIGEEARLARLVQAANNWAWEADARFRITHLSEEFEALSGHKREDFLRLGEAGGATLVRDAEFQALLEDVRAKRPYRDRINGFRAPDGRLLWILGSGEPVFDAAGHHIGWRGVSHNITGERLALQQHQRTAAMLDRVLRANPDAICVAQASTGRIRFANSGFCTLVGQPREALMGRSGLELGIWPDAREPQRLADALASSGLVRDFRSAIVVNGQWRDLLVSAASLDWEGEPATMLIARDITEHERDRIETAAFSIDAVRCLETRILRVRVGREELREDILVRKRAAGRERVAHHRPLGFAPKAKDFAQIVDETGEDHPTGLPLLANLLGGLQQVLQLRHVGVGVGIGIGIESAMGNNRSRFR